MPSPPLGSSEPSSFYRAFEDQHRGSRQLIKGRLRVYLPLIRPLADSYPDLSVLDLGCGRGEWLELLGEHHIHAHGVDNDPSMLVGCTECGLSVVQADALDHLKTQDKHSLLAVTGFHIAEHLPFAELQTLVAQVRRVLVPGGLLILETPNPENLLVGAANFYLDPTHQRPLPSQLLVFLAEHQGFAPVKLLRLQEEPRLAQDGPVSLYDVLANVSPDYAVVAQAPQARLAGDVADLPPSLQASVFAQRLAQALALDVGVSLPTLARRYDEQAQAQAQQLSQQVEQHSQQVEQHSQQVEQISQQVEQISRQARQTSDQVQQLSQQVEQQSHQAGQLSQQVEQLSHQVQQLSHQVQLLSHQAQQSAAELTAVYASQSWRLTAPLRRLARRLRGGSGPG